MFAHRFFPSRYFAARYFPPALEILVPGGLYISYAADSRTAAAADTRSLSIGQHDGSFTIGADGRITYANDNRTTEVTP